MAGKDHRDLIVWQKAMQLTIDVYNLIRQLPLEEKYALSDQMRRSAISIPSNVAEGNARESKRDTNHFLHIAQGSRAELETQLELCLRIGYLSETQLKETLSPSDEVGRMLAGLIKSLKSNL